MSGPSRRSTAGPTSQRGCLFNHQVGPKLVPSAGGRRDESLAGEWEHHGQANTPAKERGAALLALRPSGALGTPLGASGAQERRPTGAPATPALPNLPSHGDHGDGRFGNAASSSAETSSCDGSRAWPCLRLTGVHSRLVKMIGRLEGQRERRVHGASEAEAALADAARKPLGRAARMQLRRPGAARAPTEGRWSAALDGSVG